MYAKKEYDKHRNCQRCLDIVVSESLNLIKKKEKEGKRWSLGNKIIEVSLAPARYLNGMLPKLVQETLTVGKESVTNFFALPIVSVIGIPFSFMGFIAYQMLEKNCDPFVGLFCTLAIVSIIYCSSHILTSDFNKKQEENYTAQVLINCKKLAVKEHGFFKKEV